MRRRARPVRRAGLGSQRLERPPVLVLEVLSPSTRRIDLATKRMAYADAGVAAYGLVDPGVPLAHRARARSRRVQAVATVVGDEAWSETPIRAVITPSRLVD